MSDLRTRISWLSEDITDPDEFEIPLRPCLAPQVLRGRCSPGRRLLHGTAAIGAMATVAGIVWLLAVV